MTTDAVLSSAARLNPGTAPLTREETIYLPVLMVCVVTLLATTPILKVARIDPVRALREE
jgi:ABC-type antimicrobial peptide transport system permease subunit